MPLKKYILEYDILYDGESKVSSEHCESTILAHTFKEAYEKADEFTQEISTSPNVMELRIVSLEWEEL